MLLFSRHNVNNLKVDNILLNEKSFENSLIFDVTYKTAKSLRIMIKHTDILCLNKIPSSISF